MNFSKLSSFRLESDSKNEKDQREANKRKEELVKIQAKIRKLFDK